MNKFMENEEQRIVPQPKSLKVQHVGSDVSISWRLCTSLAGGLILMGLTLIWDYICALIIFSNFNLMAIPLFASGCFATYFALMVFIDRVQVDILPGVLRVRYAPLPWCHRQSLDTADVQRIKYKDHEIASHGKADYRYRYTLTAVTHDGQDIVIVRSNNDAFVEILKYLEQFLNTQLGIESFEREQPQVTQDDLPHMSLVGDRYYISPPRSIKVEELGLSVRITRKWSVSSGLFFLFGPIFLGVILFVMFRDISQLNYAVIPFALVGLGLAYIGVAFLLNKSVVDISADKFHIEHGPVPLKRSISLEPVNIKQLYCKEHEHRSGKGSSTSYTYSVNVITVDDKVIDLFSNLEDKKQAEYLEYCIEKELAIAVRPPVDEV